MTGILTTMQDKRNSHSIRWKCRSPHLKVNCVCSKSSLCGTVPVVLLCNGRGIAKNCQTHTHWCQNPWLQNTLHTRHKNANNNIDKVQYLMSTSLQRVLVWVHTTTPNNWWGNFPNTLETYHSNSRHLGTKENVLISEVSWLVRCLISEVSWLVRCPD